MQFKTSKKEIMNGYRNVICIGNQKLATMLQLKFPVAYTVRAEGVAAYIYDFGVNAICTGDACFGNVKPSRECIKEYEEDARKICDVYDNDYTVKKMRLDGLIHNFICEVTEE